MVETFHTRIPNEHHQREYAGTNLRSENVWRFMEFSRENPINPRREESRARKKVASRICRYALSKTTLFRRAAGRGVTMVRESKRIAICEENHTYARARARMRINKHAYMGACVHRGVSLRELRENELFRKHNTRHNGIVWATLSRTLTVFESLCGRKGEFGGDSRNANTTWKF